MVIFHSKMYVHQRVCFATSLDDPRLQHLQPEVNEADEGASKWLDATFNCDEVEISMGFTGQLILEIFWGLNHLRNYIKFI